MPSKFEFNFKVLIGCFCVFVSAFAFYFATVIIKWSKISGVDISPSVFVFTRFLLGFIIVIVLMGIKKQRLQVKKKGYLIGRAIANLVAVYCFFKGVDLTSVAQANILNMTYPLFIAVFSWLFLKEQQDAVAILIVMIAFVGVWLIIAPEKMSIEINSLWGLASGISAAVAIMYLNLSRQYHDTQTTLFFLFGIGSVVTFILFFNQLHLPKIVELKYLFWCSFFSIAGQYLITIGFKYVTAIEGGIISSTRILLAAVLGPFIAMDPALTLAGWIGAVLIFFGNVYLTLRKARQ
ncbi:MAG: DMT family transporter [Pseudomonadota bacterium]